MITEEFVDGVCSYKERLFEMLKWTSLEQRRVRQPHDFPSLKCGCDQALDERCNHQNWRAGCADWALRQFREHMQLLGAARNSNHEQELWDAFTKLFDLISRMLLHERKAGSLS